ncbi:hypothetical protein ACFCYB_01740 [Streptomyces sp. NPDC056309]|uniref:hypothetical protein n=1 Tax=Streptomyces sp. NPDC056309 TaxID=3345781 RepID=UPI0035E30697
MVDLAGGCGLRQGEVLGLSVEDVDFIGPYRRRTARVLGDHSVIDCRRAPDRSMAA